MKTTRYIAIEPAENGWVVLETICREKDDKSPADDEDESEGYDPSREFAKREQRGHGPHGPHCQHEDEHADEEKKIHVFDDHEKLMAFVAEKTKNFSSTST